MVGKIIFMTVSLWQNGRPSAKVISTEILHAALTHLSFSKQRFTYVIESVESSVSEEIGAEHNAVISKSHLGFYLVLARKKRFKGHPEQM